MHLWKRLALPAVKTTSTASGFKPLQSLTWRHSTLWYRNRIGIWSPSPGKFVHQGAVRQIGSDVDVWHRRQTPPRRIFVLAMRAGSAAGSPTWTIPSACPMQSLLSNAISAISYNSEQMPLISARCTAEGVSIGKLLL